MSLNPTNIEPSQPRMPKVVSPPAHGLIDYAHAAFFLGVGLLTWRSNRRAAWTALGTSGFILTQSLTTDYRYGAKPLISFETHGKMDAIFAATSWMAPVLFGFEGTAAARVFEVNSLAESSVVGMTDWDSGRAREERLAA